MEERENVVIHGSIRALTLEVRSMIDKNDIECNLIDVLERYLLILEEAERYEDAGVFATNFPEAAYMLQMAAELYTKKVDWMWDFIINYQSRLYSYEREAERQSRTAELLAERQNRYKRKRKINETLRNEEQATLKKLVDTAFTIDNQTFDASLQLSNTWLEGHIQTNINNNPHAQNYIPLTDSAFMIDAPLHLPETDEAPTTCDKLHVMSSIQEISQQHPAPLKFHDPRDDDFGTSHIYEQDHVLQRYLLTKGVNMIDVEKMLLADCKSFCTGYYREKEALILNISKSLSEKRDLLCPKRCVARISRLSQDVVEHYMKDLGNIKRSTSVVPSETIKRSNSCQPSTSSERGGDSNDDCDDSAFIEGESTQFDDDDNNNNDENSTEEISRNEEIVEEPCMSEVITNRTVAPSVTEDSNQKEVTTERTVVVRKRALKRKIEETKDATPKKRQPRRIKPKILVTVRWFEFESFYTKTYCSEEDEGKVVRIDWDSEDDLDMEDDEVPEEIDLEVEPMTDTSTQTPLEDSGFMENSQPEDNTETETTTTTPEPTPAITKKPNDPQNEITETQETQKRLREWKSYITEKIKTSASENDFDIHQYGGEIMDSMQLNETIKFKDIIRGKSRADVSRYFLATLQLANTNNIEMRNANGDGTIANETLEVRLLSRDRYHEHLSDYMAPSEETFSERLNRVRIADARITSTPYSQGSRERGNGRDEPQPSTSGIRMKKKKKSGNG